MNDDVFPSLVVSISSVETENVESRKGRVTYKERQRKRENGQVVTGQMQQSTHYIHKDPVPLALLVAEMKIQGYDL